jgi:uncharacterized protein YkwD
VCNVRVSRTIRLCLALLAIAAGGTLVGSATATSRSETSLRTLNRQVLAAVNTFRAAHGLGQLRESRALDRAARVHSLEMGKVGYFAHSSADGTAFWRRIRHYYGASSHSYWSVGENLLWSSPGVSSAGAMKMWIASPEHLRNLLTSRWREIGVSAVRVLDAPGIFGGRRVIIITTDFGDRH